MKHTPKIRHPFRDDFLSKHHCYPLGRMKHKEAPKTDFPHLTIYIWRNKHDAWHRLFRSMTFDEVIFRLAWDVDIYSKKDYHLIFNGGRLDTIKLLKRIKKIKTGT